MTRIKNDAANQTFLLVWYGPRGVWGGLVQPVENSPGDEVKSDSMGGVTMQTHIFSIEDQSHSIKSVKTISPVILAISNGSLRAKVEIPRF